MEQNNDKNIEKEFLEAYDQSDYDRPSIAVDMAVFTIKNEDALDYRRLSKKNLSVLLVKRGEYPFKDYWALPGGFVRRGETLEEAAYRELEEEAGITDVYLSQLHNYSDTNRDPRGWIISNAFMALAEENLFHIQPGSDASAAEWFRVEYTEMNTEIENTTLGRMSKTKFKMQLTHSDIVLDAIVEIRTQFVNRRIKKDFLLLESSGLAFDHAKIIAYAITNLRETLNSSMVGFELLPEYFTLTDLQLIYETILGEELFMASFRRKIADYVIETNDRVEGAGHRPSKLFKRNMEKLL